MKLEIKVVDGLEVCEEKVVSLLEEQDVNESNEILVVDEEQRSAMVKEEILQSVWAFNPTFVTENLKDEICDELSSYELEQLRDSIKDMQEKMCEGCNVVIKSMIDIDTFIENAIHSDGHGHFLNKENGEEYQLDYNGEILFAYYK
ncbi:hypothetical protein [Bacillus cereus]|uniref:Uncharacterized protein n=1 Tax=Bacillus cereus HuA3-9 TaxID=1053205 RepID=R8CIV2_BACCE|nr:hypothetical protein [Bacillus cereus]EOO11440.1 hypothetical protein IGA_05703 [Bacillus cereus HuA3-9]